MIRRSIKEIKNNREGHLEDRLLQYYMATEVLWALVNTIFGFIVGLPVQTTLMYGTLAVGVHIMMAVGYLFNQEELLKKLYFPLFLITIPIMWGLVGGNKASGNILFVCEIVVFTMCLRGLKQKIYIILSIISTSMVCGISNRFPGKFVCDMTEQQAYMGSVGIGMTTTMLIASILIRQKREYARERDIAIESENKLEASNRLQKNFLANMSHEIRSPMGIVLGFNQLISDCDDLETIHEYSHNIESAGKTLQTVINDILDYSKIESGKLEIFEVDYSLRDLVDEISKDITLKCQEKGLEYELNFEDKFPPLLHGDDIRIKQCLLNVLSNAVKYTPKGKVTLRVRYSGTNEDGSYNVTFVIQDTGKGIKPEAMPHLFNSFQRLDEGTNRGIEGTGLGLAITKNLVDEMNGEIHVESEVGKGTLFVIKLSQQPGEKVDVVAAEAVELKDIRVLVVDDTIINLTLMTNLLEREEMVVETVDSGKKCLERCEQNKYDVILLDHMMPEMNGVETFGKLKESQGPNRNTPVIALTANAMAGAMQEYLELGFDGYISKPVNVSAMKETIAAVMKKKGEE